MALRDIPAKHPWWWTGGCIATISFPQWFTAVWSIFDERPPFQVMRQWSQTMELSLPQFSPYWVTVPLGFAMFVWLIYELRRRSLKVGAGRPRFSLIVAHTSIFADKKVGNCVCFWSALRNEGAPSIVMEFSAIHIDDKGVEVAGQTLLMKKDLRLTDGSLIKKSDLLIAKVAERPVATNSQVGGRPPF
jgi:hypothetical protein